MARPRKFHPTCRPPRGAHGHDDGGDDDGNLHPKPLKLGTNGRWKRDDGEPGLAFIGGLDGNDIVWVATCNCTDVDCPRWIALEHAREKLDIQSISVHERARRGWADR